MKMGHLIFAFWVLLVSFAIPAQATDAKKILIIASNVEDMGDPDKHDARNNLWEYAPPYHIFVDEIKIVSIH